VALEFEAHDMAAGGDAFEMQRRLAHALSVYEDASALRP